MKSLSKFFCKRGFLFAFVAFVLAPHASAGKLTCGSLFKATKTSPMQRLLSDSFAPENGSALAKFSAAKHFSNEYIEKLYNEVPKVGYVDLIANHQDVFGKRSQEERARIGDPEPELVAPIYKYARTLLEVLNASLPKPERGQLRLETVRIVISDGNQPQIDQAWHRDLGRYMTALTNLKGAGTLYKTESNSVSEVMPGETLILNGYGRYFLFPGNGSIPIEHRAPEGRENLRLGIVIFFSILDVPGPAMAQLVTMTGEDSRASSQFRSELLNRLTAKLEQ